MAIDISTWQEKLVCGGGTTILDSATGLTGLKGLSIYASEDTVINTCTGFDATGTAFNFKTGRTNWSTLKAGDLLMVPDDHYFAEIDLTSGRVLINEGNR